MDTWRLGPSSHGVLSSAATQEVELPSQDPGCLSCRAEVGVGPTPLQTFQTEMGSFLTPATVCLPCLHLTKTWDAAGKRTNAFLSQPLSGEGDLLPLTASLKVSLPPSAHPSAQHCGVLTMAVVPPAPEILQGRCRSMLQGRLRSAETHLTPGCAAQAELRVAVRTEEKCRE